MARPGWSPVATLFRDNHFFIRSPSLVGRPSWLNKSPCRGRLASAARTLSFSAFFSVVCMQSIPAARRVVA